MTLNACATNASSRAGLPRRVVNNETWTLGTSLVGSLRCGCGRPGKRREAIRVTGAPHVNGQRPAVAQRQIEVIGRHFDSKRELLPGAQEAAKDQFSAITGLVI